MRHARKTRSLFAWLALIALGLTIVAPVVSRTLAGVNTSPAQHAHHDMDMSMQMPSDDAHAPNQHDGIHDDRGGMLMEQCGYCGLLGHNPLLIVIAWLPGLLPQTPARLLTRPSPQRGPEHSTLTAAPRGPPAFLHS